MLYRLRVLVIGAVVFTAACASSDGTRDTATTAPSTTAPAPTEVAVDDFTDVAVRPVVSVPAVLPTQLVITEIVAGRGRSAQVGDTVVVDYVGARSIDGQEFDNSWDRGQPFLAVLGTRSVIAGWEQGLVGAQEGARLQLDIPPDLAYGDTSPGGIIQPGDALSFVVDIRAVVPASNPDDAPDIDIPTSNGASDLRVDDLVMGDGRTVDEGAQVLAQLLVYRGDTGDLLDSTWDGAGPVRFFVAEGQLVPGLYQGLLGARQGSRRLVVMPFALAFGALGNTDLGLPPATDVVLVIDVLAVF